MIECHKLLKNIKRLQKIPKLWKVAAMSPIKKKRDERVVENYRHVSVLNIDSKVQEKLIYRALDEYFVDYLTKYQQGFVRRRSVLTNMISFLKRIYEALDKKLHDQIMAFYWDLPKAFNRVPHFELLKKLA